MKFVMIACNAAKTSISATRKQVEHDSRMRFGGDACSVADAYSRIWQQ